LDLSPLGTYSKKESSKTTEIYTHVSEKDIARIRSPLDTIMEKGNDDVKKV